jgi:hypothetical protein
MIKLKEKAIAKAKVVEKPKKTVLKMIIKDLNDHQSRVTLSYNDLVYFRFSVSISELPHCCGLNEMGNFNCEIHRNVTEEEKINAVKCLFEKIHNDYYEFDDRCIQLLFTLVPNEQASDLIRKALVDELLFKEVNRFVNINSGVENTLYISI